VITWAKQTMNTWRRRRTAGMSMLQTIMRWLRPGAPRPPAMVRVRVPGGLAEGAVAIEGRAEPSGRTMSTRVQAVQGLCIVPWLGGQRLDLRVVHGAHRGELSLGDEEVAAGWVHEVLLDAPAQELPQAS
jgi:hypothetical protein